VQSNVAVAPVSPSVIVQRHVPDTGEEVAPLATLENVRLKVGLAEALLEQVMDPSPDQNAQEYVFMPMFPVAETFAPALVVAVPDDEAPLPAPERLDVPDGDNTE